MSYNLVGYFYYKDKLISEAGLDYLKNVNPMRYSSLLDDNINTIEPIDVELPKEAESVNYYNYNSFEQSLPYYKKLVKKAKDKLNKIKKVGNSCEYYKLDYNQKEDYFQSKDDCKEVLNDYKWALKSVKYIMDIFEYLSNLRIGDEYYRNINDIILVLSVS